MTSQALNRPVDVLAVMDADAHAIALLCDLVANRLRDEWEAHIPKHDAARAAVAGLIKLVRRMEPFLEYEADKYIDDGKNEPLELLRSLRDALAAIGSQP